ncbi:hypothetical protein [uncultured Paraglaciecola sp.]|uniref:hypothetical protein n=1 Tax=uncultured Paraglaciecola sp. TaxID=1765024 RepID=UPI00260A00B1|nr:hypothetical protein [uncultured Paraglaciecola sp.]
MPDTIPSTIDFPEDGPVKTDVADFPEIDHAEDHTPIDPEMTNRFIDAALVKNLETTDEMEKNFIAAARAVDEKEKTDGTQPSDEETKPGSILTAMENLQSFESAVSTQRWYDHVSEAEKTYEMHRQRLVDLMAMAQEQLDAVTVNLKACKSAMQILEPPDKEEREPRTKRK